MASTSNFVSVTLTEHDVPGAKLDTQDFGKYSNTQLKRWLQCRGLPVSGNRPNLLARLNVNGTMGSICTSNERRINVIKVLPLKDKDEKTKSENVANKGSITNNLSPDGAEDYSRALHRKEKKQIFKAKDYENVDKHVSEVSEALLMAPYKAVVLRLTSDPNWNDLAKVRAIFVWLISIDIYKLRTDEQAENGSTMNYIAKIKNNNGSHAHLFYKLCMHANINCKIINGMTKNSAYEIGGMIDRNKMGAQWNAVFVEHSWRFIDVLWASSCMRKHTYNPNNITNQEKNAEQYIHQINEFYFLPDADKFIFTHFPDEEEWQLLETPVPIKKFEKLFYMRETFHTLGLKIIADSQTKAYLHTVAGQINICFGLPDEDTDYYRFKHILYKPTEHSDSHMAMYKSLERYILFEHTPTYIHYSLRLPITGKFRMEIYGLDVRDNDIFDLACSYLIECQSATLNTTPFPDNPEIGWGPCIATKQAGLIPLSHNEAIIQTQNGIVDIYFNINPGREIDVYPDLKHTVIDQATLTRYGVIRQEVNKVVLSLRLPNFGEYVLKLFAQDSTETGEAPNVCNYLIEFDGVDMDKQQFPNISDSILGKHYLANTFDVSALTHPGGLIKAKCGELSVKFRAPPTTNLVCELHTHDPHCSRTMGVTSVEKDGKWTFSLYLPKEGEYSLNIFAKLEPDSTRLHSMYSYLVKSFGIANFNSDIKDHDYYKQNLITSETIETSDKKFDIPLLPYLMNPKVELYKRYSKEPPRDNEIGIFRRDDSSIIEVQLKSFAEYMLNVYDTNENGTVFNVARYQINRKLAGDVYNFNIFKIKDMLQKHGSIPSTIIKPRSKTASVNNTKDAIRQEAISMIEQAVHLQHDQLLEEATSQYLNTHSSPRLNDPVLRKGWMNLTMMKAKLHLQNAYQQRNVDLLEEALKKAMEVNTDHKLDVQIAIATKLVGHLHNKEDALQDLLNVDTEEIKSYRIPPEEVHRVMMATFILLGSKFAEVRKWLNIQVLMGKEGNDSLMTKIITFDPKKVNLTTAKMANKQIKYIQKNYTASANGVEEFYNWVTVMILEIKSFGGADMELKKHRRKSKTRDSLKSSRRDSLKSSRRDSLKSSHRDSSKSSSLKPSRKESSICENSN